jgi:hypothetical protein
MPARKRREYLRYLDAAKAAAETGIDAFNCAWHRYRNQTTLLLLANAWELLAKAVLLADKQSISRGNRGETIAAEVAVHRLKLKGLLDENQSATIQQVISLRHSACHSVLPEAPPEVMQHLLFYSLKFFRATVEKQFPGHAKGMSDNYLTLSFAELTTYADKVQRLVSRIKRQAGDKRLVWLLERGVRFDGAAYITEAEFEQSYRKRKRILPHLGLSNFVRNADMVRIVPIQAPRNFTADISLRKGSAADASLPVIVKKTDVEADYPYLTKELGNAIGKNQNWAAKAATILNLKGDPKFHQAVRASANSMVHRYSAAALDVLKSKLKTDPTYDPYHA